MREKRNGSDSKQKLNCKIVTYVFSLSMTNKLVPRHALIIEVWGTLGGSPSDVSGKNPPANAGDIRDVGLIPGLRRSLEEGVATHPSTLAWRIPQMEKPGGL